MGEPETIGELGHRRIGLHEQRGQPLHPHPRDLAVDRVSDEALEADVEGTTREPDMTFDFRDRGLLLGTLPDESQCARDDRVVDGEDVGRLARDDSERLDEVQFARHSRTGQHLREQ